MRGRGYRTGHLRRLEGEDRIVEAFRMAFKIYESMATALHSVAGF